MDTETATAIAALVIAVFAMIIALGQVTQQYASSGHQYRLCDSVVFGGEHGLPGQGRRLWSFGQLRFRVVYDVPAFGFPVHQGSLWEAPRVSAGRHGTNIDLNDHYLARLRSDQYHVGEASWVSFCRKAKDPCADRIVFTMIRGDADRCPGDLPNVPMPVSLRDVIVMAFSFGLDCVEASFVAKTLSMQGSAGSITTSRHPVLGPLIHFIPQQEYETTRTCPKNWSRWVARLEGLVPAAQEILYSYGHRGLRYIEQQDICLQKLRTRFQYGHEHDSHCKPHDKILGEDIQPELQKDNTALKEDGAFLEYTRDLLEKESRRPDIFSDYQLNLDDNKSDPEKPERSDDVLNRTVSRVGSDLYPQILGPIDSRTEPAPYFGRANARKDSSRILGIDWYWMSQMNILEGPWATPWKTQIHAEVCRYAFKVVRNALLHVDPVASSCTSRVTAAKLKGNYQMGFPFQTFPPYAYGAIHGMSDIGAMPASETQWIYVVAYGKRLPPLYILYDDVSVESDAPSYFLELMGFDQWLWRAGESEAIAKGQGQLLRHTPAFCDHVLSLFSRDFERNYVTGEDTIQCGKTIREILRQWSLSDAERVFLYVALIRTLRVAICIGTGLDTSQALEILEKDIRAHMV